MRKKIAYIIVAFFLVMVLTPNTYAKITDNTLGDEHLTIEQAVEIALKNSRNLQSAEYDIERAEELRKTASDKVKFTPIGPTTTAASMAFTGLVAADISWNMTKRTMSIAEDKIVLNVISNYLDVVMASNNLEHARKKADVAQYDYWVATLHMGVGNISDSDIILAQKSCDMAKKAIDNAELDLERAMLNFNYALGVSPECKWVLTEESEYNVLELLSLDAEINKIMKLSPAIWSADQYVHLANLQLDLHSWNDPMSEPYRAKQIDVIKAELGAAETKEQMRNAIRTIYTAIKQIEESIDLMQNQLVIADERLRVAKVNYDLGIITLAEIKKAELGLREIEKEIKHLEYEHAKLKLSFEKPWAAAM